MHSESDMVSPASPREVFEKELAVASKRVGGCKGFCRKILAFLYCQVLGASISGIFLSGFAFKRWGQLLEVTERPDFLKNCPNLPKEIDFEQQMPKKREAFGLGRRDRPFPPPGAAPTEEASASVTTRLLAGAAQDASFMGGDVEWNSLPIGVAEVRALGRRHLLAPAALVEGGGVATQMLLSWRPPYCADTLYIKDRDYHGHDLPEQEVQGQVSDCLISMP